MNQKIQHSIIKKLSRSLLIILCVALIAGNASAAGKKLKTRIKVEYVKKGDNTKQIKATVSSKVKRKRVTLKGVALNLFDETDSTRLISTATTDKKGITVFTLPADYPVGKDGAPSVFAVRFDGNEKYKPASKKIEIKDVKLTADFKVVDSVYTIEVTANEMVNGTTGAPVSDVDVYVYVKRLFSLLKVGEGYLEDGKATIEIPNDIPGEYKTHNLEFVTMIPEADDYGTVENNKTIKWGAPAPKYPKYDNVNQRALWEPRAPLWMVITLGILLLGVFYHYFLIACKLYKIKQLGKNERA